MENELYEGIAARAGENCRVAVVGPAQCGKTSFVRALADGLGAEREETEGRSRVCTQLPRAEGASFAFCAEECAISAADGAAAVLVTADGSFAGVSRASLPTAEEGMVRRLRESGMPFVIVLNSAAPTAGDCVALRAALEEKYGAAVLAMNCAGKADVDGLLEALLLSFPVSRLDVYLPDWLSVLPPDSKMIAEILAKVRETAPRISCLRDCSLLERAFGEGDVYCEWAETDVNAGRARYRLAAKEGVFYRVLSEECGAEIGDDLRLMAYVRSMREAKQFYDRYAAAFAAAEENGYGIVQPTEEDLALQAPALVRRGAKCGVRLSADAPSYHIIKVGVHSDVSPIAGEAEHGEELARSMVDRYEQDPEALWNTDMFGRTFKDMVREGLREKTMPLDAREKLRKAVTRIVNEGKGGVLCILL